MSKSQLFYLANMSFNAICENKILAKISVFTVLNILSLGSQNDIPKNSYSRSKSILKQLSEKHKSHKFNIHCCK